MSSSKHGENSGEDGGSPDFEMAEIYNTAGVNDDGDLKLDTIEGGSNHDTEVFFDAPTVDTHDLEAKKATEQEDKDNDEENEENLPSKFYERMVKVPCCNHCLERFPRTCAVLVGVLLPLLMLVSFSIVFGRIICENESRPEISSNDERLASLYTANATATAIRNLAVVLPRVCTVLYLSGKNFTDNPNDVSSLVDLIKPFVIGRPAPGNLSALLVPDRGNEYPEDEPRLFNLSKIAIGAKDFYTYMSECGLSGQQYITQAMIHSMANVSVASTPLTFNWIRCFEGAKPRESSSGTDLTVEQRSSTGQSQVFASAWNTDRLGLYDKYFLQNIKNGMSVEHASRNATVDSVNDASGGGTCGLNTPAAAWFWFVVQTTVGYGNAPVTTSASRAMVYTLGFFSILAFGGILAIAGYILNFVFDDQAVRWGGKVLVNPWVGSLIWGSMYYSWMVLIAYVTMWWKRERLGIEFDMKEGYWFAYISTTTIGFGDIYLEPEGIITMDNLTFPVLFLAGFVFLSMFVGKFAGAISSVVHSGRMSFVDTLLNKHVNWNDTFAAKKSETAQGDVPEAPPDADQGISKKPGANSSNNS